MHAQLLGNATLQPNNTIAVSQLTPGTYKLQIHCRLASYCTAQPTHLSFTRFPFDRPTSLSAADRAVASEQHTDVQPSTDGAETDASASAGEEDSADSGLISKMEATETAAENAANGRALEIDRGGAGLSSVQVLQAVVRVVHDSSAVGHAGFQDSFDWAKPTVRHSVQGAVLLCLLACQVSIAVLS